VALDVVDSLRVDVPHRRPQVSVHAAVVGMAVRRGGGAAADADVLAAAVVGPPGDGEKADLSLLPAAVLELRAPLAVVGELIEEGVPVTRTGVGRRQDAVAGGFLQGGDESGLGGIDIQAVEGFGHRGPPAGRIVLR
jgi:hypothetical protein